MVGTCEREAAKITSKPPGLTHHLHRYLYIKTSYIAICNDLDARIRMPMHAIEAVGPLRRNSSHQKCQRKIHRDLYLNPGISHAHELDPDGVAAPAAHPLAAPTRSRRAPTPEPPRPPSLPLPPIFQPCVWLRDQWVGLDPTRILIQPGFWGRIRSIHYFVVLLILGTE